MVRLRREVLGLSTHQPQRNSRCRAQRVAHDHLPSFDRKVSLVPTSSMCTVTRAKVTARNKRYIGTLWVGMWGGLDRLVAFVHHHIHDFQAELRPILLLKSYTKLSKQPLFCFFFQRTRAIGAATRNLSARSVASPPLRCFCLFLQTLLHVRACRK